jgi:AcrR family transcriptional regulator
MRSPVGEGKQRLLEALFGELDENGPSPNLSIRYIAERLDVHHTLLTYHFGSRAGLLAAVLSEARPRDNLVIAATNPEFGFVLDEHQSVDDLSVGGGRSITGRGFRRSAGTGSKPL